MDTHRALSEQLELGQQLREKAGADEDSDAEEVSDWDGEGEQGEGAVMARAAGKVRTLLGEVVA